MIKSKVLVIDDDESLADILGDILTSAGYDVKLAQSGWQAFELLHGWTAQVILLDLKLPGMDGLSVLRQLQQQHPLAQVIMISGHGSIRTAVEAVRLGAIEWMEKPLDKERVLTVIAAALDKNIVLQEKSYSVQESLQRFGMIGVSPAMQTVFQLIDRVSGSDVTVLIRGKSGTGKELVAQAIHQNSQRAKSAFVNLNCAAIPDTLIESELFGHNRGAFTGAHCDQIGHFHAANRGTLFFDEIGDLSQAAQAKVLRAIEAGEVSRLGSTKTEIVDVRFISATNKDLNLMIQKNLFRQDLYHRIAVIEIVLPPLRERIQDILPLASHCLRLYCARHGLEARAFEANCYPVLLAHAWPGNVRELRNFIEKLIILTDSNTFTGQQAASLLKFPSSEINCSHAFTFSELKACFEQAILLPALESNDWNILKSAEQLGMERSVLYKKIEKYRLRKMQKKDS